MKFLVAVDGSEASDAALDHAIEIVSLLDGSLTVVHAVEPNVEVQGGSGSIDGFAEANDRIVEEPIEDAEARGERVLEEAASLVRESDVPVETDLLYGDPLETVPEYAEKNGYAGIFVGHRGLSDRYEEMVGSVAKGLIERASVPVTVVRWE
jgi:nucleotide-binding universal stress UspA family protein